MHNMNNVRRTAHIGSSSFDEYVGKGEEQDHMVAPQTGKKERKKMMNQAIGEIFLFLSR